eukprot:6193688-Pleurochrysis_carterae.AAC.2
MGYRYTPIALKVLTPKEGGKALTAVYAEGGICGISPVTRSGASDRRLCFTWCRLPRMMKTIIYMGLRAIL